MLTCSNCGTQNPDGSAFCSSCGSSLTLAGTGQLQPPVQPYAQPQSQNASGKAVAALILALLGLVMCGPFTSIPAMIVGKQELNAIDAGQSPEAGRTLAQIGFWVGLAATVLFCLGIILYVAVVGLGVFYSGAWY